LGGRHQCCGICNQCRGKRQRSDCPNHKLTASQPVNSLGIECRFTAGVSGDAPLSLQWHLDGVPLSDSSHVAGSATTNLAIFNAQLTDSGKYTLVVTNPAGSVSSTNATLTVLSPAIIISRP